MPPVPAPPAVEPDLLAAVVRGDASALDVWYRSEHPVVHRLCFGFLADSWEADDAAQDAMLHLLDRLDAYQPHRPYPAWRNTVVLNLCRDRLRRAATRRAAEDRRPEGGLPRALPRPDDAAAANEVAELLRASLAALSPREREAFVLRDLQGGETAEVAAVLGVTESSVRSLLTLARRRLRRLLGPHLPEFAGAGRAS